MSHLSACNSVIKHNPSLKKRYLYNENKLNLKIVNSINARSSLKSYLQNRYKDILYGIENNKLMKFIIPKDPQFSSIAQSCPTLCDLMDCSIPGFPVHHQLPELAQTHIHRVSDAIQPCHPLSLPYPLALNLSQHQGLFK